MTKRRLTILGATGSIGQSTLDLVYRQPERFQVVALTAHHRVAELAEAAIRSRAELAVVADPAHYPSLKARLAGRDIEVAAGPEAVIEAARRASDWTMAAIVGAGGLAPTLAAAERGGVLALANKEALVCSGPLLLDAVRRSSAVLLPVDSEHNALFQALAGRPATTVRRLILTASGGPFRTASLATMAAATPAEAVAHPKWSMGAKISVDSATMMNKGLELIEAHLLFGVAAAKLDVLIHPQSIVHGIVEYEDGSQLAQVGPTDMRVPIAHTLAWPDRLNLEDQRLDLAAVGRLEFEAPDEARFPALRLAREALQTGGGAPTIMNAANEVAVAAFLEERLGFLDIVAVVEAVLEGLAATSPTTLAEVLALDAAARDAAAAAVDQTSRQRH
ncbi:MAG: 1-deoxy-D-xylulose-5-phosphate reductoisomerase [Geminicoccaceae bacterium]|nr:MAG: 1-deoxy-D-xylulose-5-phosphate reductoisomerase [Geminicoccaceae bacterium]